MKKRIRIILKYVKYSFNRKKYSNQAIKRLEELTQQYDYSQCEYVVKNPRMSGNRDIFPKAWFEDKVMMPFESLQVAIPFMYHHWLSHIYGNYMQLPPEDQRISNHTFVYYNLDRRLELNEVLDEVKRMDKLNKK